MNPSAPKMILGGGVMPGESVATVVASQSPAYSKSGTVSAQAGWRTHALSNGANLAARRKGRSRSKQV
jgi:NADPH-dependent curcumin reductase CurA